MKTFIAYGPETQEYYNDETGDVECEEYVLIDKIFVSPADRGKGIAGRMLGSALEEIKELHPGLPVRIAALPFGEGGLEMEALVGFYKNHGFEIINTDGDAVIMELM